ncbi:MAG TPA: D-alanine--D-alanine ligase [Thermodesulfovibrionales bacterium]|jgi:D-alanine-D-alanine ligase|nr:D-alanine--D-alanine ligase [Thermodesulfovibrionales bacterium]
MAVTDKRIGVLMGGTSTEREVSLKSGTAVLNALKGLGYDVHPIDVGRDVCEVLKRERIEIAFLVLHGGHGENGDLQGLLEVMGIPYTGSGVLASALAMDKEAAKKIFLYHGIPVPPFTMMSKGAFVKGKSDMEEKKIPALAFGLPWVVKPASEGSSIGVSIIKDEDAFPSALENAFVFGHRAIIEKYVEGREVQIGILGERVLGAVEVRPKAGFYNYEAKYTAGLTEYILPSDIPADTLKRTEEVALAAHLALGCRGVTRVDTIIDGAGNPNVLEVNTIPGMTETSLLPKIAQQSGLSFPALMEAILGETIIEGKGGR